MDQDEQKQYPSLEQEETANRKRSLSGERTESSAKRARRLFIDDMAEGKQCTDLSSAFTTQLTQRNSMIGPDDDEEEEEEESSDEELTQSRGVRSLKRFICDDDEEEEEIDEDNGDDEADGQSFLFSGSLRQPCSKSCIETSDENPFEFPIPSSTHSNMIPEEKRLDRRQLNRRHEADNGDIGSCGSQDTDIHMSNLNIEDYVSKYLDDVSICRQFEHLLWPRDDLRTCGADWTNHYFLHHGGLPCPGFFIDTAMDSNSLRLNRINYNDGGFFPDGNGKAIPSTLLHDMVVKTFYSERRSGRRQGTHPWSATGVLHHAMKYGLNTCEPNYPMNAQPDSRHDDLVDTQAHRDAIRSIFRSLACIVCVVVWDDNPPDNSSKDQATIWYENMVSLLHQTVLPECFFPKHDHMDQKSYKTVIRAYNSLLQSSEVFNDSGVILFKLLRARQLVSVNLTNNVAVESKFKRDLQKRLLVIEQRMMSLISVDVSQVTDKALVKLNATFDACMNIVVSRFHEMNCIITHKDSREIKVAMPYRDSSCPNVPTYVYSAPISLANALGEFNSIDLSVAKAFSQCSGGVTKLLAAAPEKIFRTRKSDTLERYRVISFKNGLYCARTGIFYFHKDRVTPQDQLGIDEFQWDFWSDHYTSQPGFEAMKFFAEDFDYFAILRLMVFNYLFLKFLYRVSQRHELSEQDLEILGVNKDDEGNYQDPFSSLDHNTQELISTYFVPDHKAKYMAFKMDARCPQYDILARLWEHCSTKWPDLEFYFISATTTFLRHPQRMYQDKYYHAFNPLLLYVRSVQKIVSDQKWTYHTLYDQYCSNGRDYSGILRRKFFQAMNCHCGYDTLTTLANAPRLDDKLEYFRYVHGRGGVGKSTLQSYRSQFVDDQYIGKIPNEGRGSPLERLTLLFGNYAFITAEDWQPVPHNPGIRSTELKLAVSTEAITLYRLRKESEVVIPKVHSTFGSNLPPGFKDTKNDLSRRINIAVMDEKIDDSTRRLEGESIRMTLDDIFEQEKLKFLLASTFGYTHKLISDGYHTYNQGNADPDSVKHTKTFSATMNPIQSFVQHYVQQGKMAIGSGSVSARKYLTNISSLYGWFRQYCGEIGSVIPDKMAFQKGICTNYRGVNVVGECFNNVRFGTSSNREDTSASTTVPRNPNIVAENNDPLPEEAPRVDENGNGYYVAPGYQ
jgi:hypothetical protein